MSNPFILGLRRNPQKFLDSLSSEEMQAMVEACIRMMERRAKAGDPTAGPALQSLYRQLGEVEV